MRKPAVRERIQFTPVPIFSLAFFWCVAALTADPARDPGREFDLQGFIDTALQAGDTHVRVEPGRYRVQPRRSQHLVLRGDLPPLKFRHF